MEDQVSGGLFSGNDSVRYDQMQREVEEKITLEDNEPLIVAGD